MQRKLFVRTGLMVFTVGLCGLAGDTNAQFPELIPTKIGLVKFGGAPPVGKLYKLVSKAVSPALFQLPSMSPAVTGGTLVVTMGAGTLSCTLAPGLFNGTVGWRELGNPAGSKGYKYLNKNAPTTDPCKLVIVKGKVIKVLAKGTGGLPLPVGYPPGSPDLGTVLSLGADDYCALWVPPHSNEKTDKLIKAKSQTEPSSCAGFVTTTTTTTSSTTTTTFVDVCCPTNPGAIGFATIDPGTERPKCGEMRNFRCGQPGACAGDPELQCVLDSDCPVADRPCEGEGNSNFITKMCSPAGLPEQCDFGPCYVTPPVCSGATAIPCSTDADCRGECLERTSEGFPIDIDCGGLYTGGGLNSVPLPLIPPDRGVSIQEVTDCSNGILTLGPIAQSEIGPNYGPDGQGLNCTQGKKCDPGMSPNPDGLDGNGLCKSEDDCGCVFGNGCCVERCLFGAPLPIPNAVTPPTSVCIRNVIAQDTSGTVDCQDGGADITIPIASVIHVTGDLLNKSHGPDVPGLQTCPLCSKVCVAGDNAGFPCENDSDCDSNNCTELEQCIAGPNDGQPCTPETSRLDVHSCCFNGGNFLQRCETHADCAPPPGPAPRCEQSFASCTDDSDCVTFPGDSCIKCVPGCTSYPTSHDCPPDPGADITFRIGGLPIDFSLTDQLNELEAVDLSDYGRRTFCGFCKDVTGAGTLCFEGDLDMGCPAAIPPADGNGVPCTSDADCVADRCLDGINRNLICSDDSDCPGSSCVADTDEYESCAQRNPGAFSRAAATTFWSQGSTDGQWLSDYQCHDATLVGIFCIPPTFDATIDSAGDLPGPGVSNLIGKQRLATSPDQLLPLDGDICQ